MEDNLSLKTKILLSLSLNSFLKKGNNLPLPYWFLHSCFPQIEEKRILNSIFKLESENCLFRSFIGKTSYISITEKGEERLSARIKFVNFLREKWDGKFRMILFDIPESDRKIRDQFRNILLELGCVCWQKSVFVTTHLIENLIAKEVKKLGIEDEVCVMLIDGPLNDRERWVWDLWKLEPINNSYNFFISQARSLLEGKISNYDRWVLDCQRARFGYYILLCKEPFLPSVLMGKNYLLEKAEECYGSLGKKLVRVLERV